MSYSLFIMAMEEVEGTTVGVSSSISPILIICRSLSYFFCRLFAISPGGSYL
jgi:hypothetical protein